MGPPLTRRPGDPDGRFAGRRAGPRPFDRVAPETHLLAKNYQHLLDGRLDPFSVMVVGHDEYDSYAHLGGTGTAKIDPNPPG